MKLRILSTVVGAFSILVVSALAIPISSTVTAVATFTPGSTDTQSDSWNTVPHYLLVSAGAEYDGRSSMNSLVEAAFTVDGNSGGVTLQTAWGIPQNSGLTSAASEGTSWAYTFIADATGNFIMDYVVKLDGSNTFGLNGIQLTGDLGGAYFAAESNGQYIASVLAGHTYSIHLGVNANLSSDNLSGFSGWMSGGFRFSLPGGNPDDPVGLPDATGTASLMLLSFAGLFALRRRFARS